MAKWAGNTQTDHIGKKAKDKFLVWDIETAKITVDGIDLMQQRPLGIACCATLTSDGDLKLWHGDDQMTPSQCRDLVQYLWKMHFVLGYTITGWNSAGFDWDILAEESGMLKTCGRLARGHIDPMFHFFCEKGFPVSLAAVALGMQLEGKSGHGADAPQLWAEGKRQQVLDYVAQDVRVTMNVFQEIQKRGYVKWITRAGKARQWVPSSGRLLTVREAMKLPEPDTSWMTNYWGREKFTSWLEKEK